MVWPINSVDNENGKKLIVALPYDPSTKAYGAARGTFGVLALGEGHIGIYQKQDDGISSNWTEYLTGGLAYSGTWDANLNVPNLVAMTPLNGQFWIVSVAGNTNLGGITDWKMLDWAVYRGAGVWDKIDNTDLVVSVNTKTGAVSLVTDDIPEGITKKYYSDTLVSANVDVAANSANRHAPSMLGTKQIDELNIADGRVVSYKSSSGKLEYVDKGGGAGALATDKYYVDGELGDDAAATLDPTKAFKTIQSCLNSIGQPISHIDAMRTIHVFISGNRSAAAGYSPQTFNGCYPENLTVPSRRITFIGYGVKIGDNGSGIPANVGNILKEYSTSRRFGATSSELRACLTFAGLCIARDSHQRLRNGFHIQGTCRTSILRRSLSSIQGDGVNKITVEVAAGQFYYPITVTANYPTEPYIRINVNNTTNYNGNYDITTKIDNTHFIATRVSGTNANVGVETSGLFLETDSAGSGAITHDACSINTYMQGQYVCDDGIVNLNNDTVVPPSAGTEVLYSVGSRWYTGLTGRTILAQRWEDTTLSSISFTAGSFIKGATYTITAIGSTDFTLIGASSNTVGIVFTATGVGVGSGTALLNNQINSIAGLFNCSLSGALMLQAAFTYGTDDMGLINNRFNTAMVITLNVATTVRMDSVTYNSFLGAGCSWAINTPTIDFLDQDRAIKNTSSVAGTTVKDALNTLLGMGGAATIKYAGILTTIGGADPEVFNVPGVLATDIVFAMLQTLPGGTLYGLAGAAPSANTITIEFGSDPGAGRKVGYAVLRV